MPTPRPPRSPAAALAVRALMARLDDQSKTYLTQAAGLRGISLSDYVRTVTVAQARMAPVGTTGAAEPQEVGCVPSDGVRP